MITLIFLGRLAELAGLGERAVAAPLDWARLLDVIGPALADAAQDANVRVAVNGVLLADKAAFHAVAGDEVALLPPVSGG